MNDWVIVYFFISRRPSFRFCYECGRSVGVRLEPCSRCKAVFYCSKACQNKAWAEVHKDECLRVPGLVLVIQLKHFDSFDNYNQFIRYTLSRFSNIDRQLVPLLSSLTSRESLQLILTPLTLKEWAEARKILKSWQVLLVYLSMKFI